MTHVGVTMNCLLLEVHSVRRRLFQCDVIFQFQPESKHHSVRKEEEEASETAPPHAGGEAAYGR